MPLLYLSLGLDGLVTLLLEFSLPAMICPPPVAGAVPQDAASPAPQVATMLRFSLDDSTLSVLGPALLAAWALLKADMAPALLACPPEAPEGQPFHPLNLVVVEWGHPVLSRPPGEEGDAEEEFECDEDIAQVGYLYPSQF